MPVAQPAWQGVTSTLDQARVIVPIAFSRGRPLLRARIDAGEARLFALDTGTSWSVVIDPRVAEELELPTEARVTSSDGTGRSRSQALTTLGQLDLGGARFTAVPALVQDLGWVKTGYREPLAGLLGFGLLAEAVATLDLAGEELVLAPGREASGVPARGPPTLRVQLGQTVIEALVDSGSATTLNLPLALAASLPWTRERQRAGTAISAYGRAPRWSVAPPGPLLLGGLTLTVDRIYVTEGLQQPILGTGVLRQIRVGFAPGPGTVSVRPRE